MKNEKEPNYLADLESKFLVGRSDYKFTPVFLHKAQSRAKAKPSFHDVDVKNSERKTCRIC